MKVALYILLGVLFFSCGKTAKNLGKVQADLDDYKVKIDSLLNVNQFNEWCEFHLRGEEGTLNYMDVMHFHQLIGSANQHAYADIYDKKDIVGRYFLDLTVKDTMVKLYNLCVYDGSDDFELYQVYRIQKGPKSNESHILYKKTYIHGNYPCSEDWFWDSFEGFGRIGKQHYYIGTCGTGSGYCREDRTILNADCTEFTSLSIPSYLWLYTDLRFIAYNSRWKSVNDSTINVTYYWERGMCPNPDGSYCEIEEMKRKKWNELLQFKIRKDTIVCFDTAVLNKLNSYW